MQRQRDSLVPIGEAISGPGDPVEAIHSASPQARHHFTQADQVNQLVAASEATPDLGFIARMMALCSLPRSNPGNRLQYKRVNGPFTLIMTATGNYKLPYDNPKPGFGSGGFALRVHADIGRLEQRQRREHRRSHPSPQPDESLVSRQR